MTMVRRVGSLSLLLLLFLGVQGARFTHQWAAHGCQGHAACNHDDLPAAPCEGPIAPGRNDHHDCPTCELLALSLAAAPPEATLAVVPFLATAPRSLTDFAARSIAPPRVAQARPPPIC